MKLVLENLEANKRFLIATRSPDISKTDKIVPLRIDALCFDDNEIRMNTIVFRFDNTFRFLLETAEQARRRNMKSLEPADILLNNRRNERILDSAEVKYSKYSSDYSSLRLVNTRSLPEDITISDAMKKLACYFLENRENIQVRSLNIWNSSQNVLRLPQNLKLKVRRFGISENDISLLENILDSSCFPLDAIRTEAWKEEYFKNPVVQSSAEILLTAPFSNESTDYWHRIVMKIQNKSVRMNNLCFSGREIRAIIKNWVDNKREIGSYLVLNCSGKRFLQRLMRKVKERFNGSFVTFKEVSKSFIFVSDIVSIPLDTNSELIVYGYKLGKKCKNIGIRIKVLTTGLAIPVEEKKSSPKFLWFS